MTPINDINSPIFLDLLSYLETPIIIKEIKHILSNINNIDIID